MTTDVGICNLALSHLGDDATVVTISPPEGSPQAEHCELFYPIARDALLEMFPWNFSTRRTSNAAALTSETTTWQYAFGLPNNALNIFGVLPAGATNNYAASFNDYLSYQYLPFLSAPVNSGGGFITQPYARETLMDGTQVIYTNQENAEIRFAVRVTDAGIFSPLFVIALSHLLASYLAGPVIKGKEGRAAAVAQYQLFLAAMDKACTSDANQQKAGVNWAPTWMRDR